MCARLLLSLLILGYPDLATAQTYLPDYHHTPGALNPEATQENIRSTICSRGYTKQIRPPRYYTDNLKKKQMHALGLHGSPHDYEEDHLVPLCVGGAPHDIRNLWPQPRSGEWGAAVRDQLEESVCRQLCRGDISLKNAQAIFLEPDWTVAYRRYFRR
jgi:hypothetical protein